MAGLSEEDLRELEELAPAVAQTVRAAIPAMKAAARATAELAAKAVQSPEGKAAMKAAGEYAAKATGRAIKQKVDAKQLSPDNFRKEYGRCPPGFNWDSERSTCVKVKKESALFSSAVNELLEEIQINLLEDQLDDLVAEAEGLLDACGYEVLAESLDDYIEILESADELDELSLEEKDLLGKIGKAIRTAAATYGKLKGKYQANKDRWDSFKQATQRAYKGGKDSSYAKSARSWNPEYQKKKPSQKKKKKAGPKRKLKPDEKMVFGRVVKVDPKRSRKLKKDWDLE